MWDSSDNKVTVLDGQGSIPGRDRFPLCHWFGAGAVPHPASCPDGIRSSTPEGKVVRTRN